MADVDISAEAVERRATRIERYAEQRRSEAGNWARGSSLHTEVLAHAETIAGDAATLRALRAAVEAAAQKNAMRWREQYRQEMPAMTWHVVSHVTYATLHRDGSEAPSARFHVIAEADYVARILNEAEKKREAANG